MPSRLAEYEPGCCQREKPGDGSTAYRTVHEWNMLTEQSAGAVGHALSRRDYMKVAWHEMPGKCAIRDPSRRERYDLIASFLPATSARRNTMCAEASAKHARRPDHTAPYGRDRYSQVSRHYVPGYHHVVPSGRKSASKARQRSTIAFAPPVDFPFSTPTL
jgi:hypothetical protein